MQVVDEAKSLGWSTFMGKPTVHCKVFEDNSGALEMAQLPKMRPRTKHLCVRLHHFREHVRKKLISIVKVMSEDQLADMLTKPQPEALFVRQREAIMQWQLELVDLDKLRIATSHLRACNIMSHERDLNGMGQRDDDGMEERSRIEQSQPGRPKGVLD